MSRTGAQLAQKNGYHCGRCGWLSIPRPRYNTSASHSRCPLPPDAVAVAVDLLNGDLLQGEAWVEAAVDGAPDDGAEEVGGGLVTDLSSSRVKTCMLFVASG